MDKKLILVPTIENGEEFCIQVRFSFFLFIPPPQKKLSSTKSNQTGLSAISY